RALSDSQERAHAQLFHLRAIEDLDLDPGAVERSPRALDEGLGVDDVGRLGHQLAGEGYAFVNRRPAFSVAPLRIGSTADDYDFVKRRLLLVLELGPVAVVAPRPQRRRQADPGGRIGVEIEP